MNGYTSGRVNVRLGPHSSYPRVDDLYHRIETAVKWRTSPEEWTHLEREVNGYTGPEADKLRRFYSQLGCTKINKRDLLLNLFNTCKKNLTKQVHYFWFY